MKGKVSDICPKCKHCEGMVAYSFYVCGDSHSDGGLYHLIGSEDELYCTAYEEEANMNKVEGKASDWCPKCKNCKGMNWGMYDEKNDGLTEVECEDPYDGMTKTLDADSNVCCSMFELKKEKEPFNLNMPREAIKAIAKLNDVICELEKEKAAHLKGIERLKKSQEKLQNQVKNLQTTNEESYKREGKLEEKLNRAEKLLSEELGKSDSWKRDYERLRDQFIYPIYNILYPDNPNIDINVTDLLNDVKNLKVYGNENKSMYEDLKYWKERCHEAETNVTTLNSKVEVLEKKLHKADSIRDAVWNEAELNKKISELEARVKYWGDIATGSAGQIINFKDEISKLNQTISDQEVTIKALLITIKEMCKEEA